MCGLLGIIQTEDVPLTIDRSHVDRMLLTLVERGPDDEGMLFERNVCLAHRRLAIRDLEVGRQPWLSPRGECALVYNGELYNDQELRSELVAAGHRFRSRCDTEVIMAAYLQWGRSCVDRFRGMFALGLYDFRDQSLWLVRDRFGIKPLYYAQLGTQLVFASRVATILAHPDCQRRPDWTVLNHYLTTTRTTLGQACMYAGISQLLPAQQMLWQGGQPRLSRYWNYPTLTNALPYDDAVEHLHEELRLAVELRLRSDVPVGMFLSGGVDSSTIATLVRNSGHHSMYATCGGVASEPSSAHEPLAEVQFAQRCADEVGFQLEPTCIDSHRYRDQWQRLVQDYRLPLSTPSDVVIYELARAAKQHVGTVLGGEGSDELLCGYGVQHWSGHDYDAVRNRREPGQGGDQASSSMLASIRRQYGRDMFASEADHYFALNSLVPATFKGSALNPDVWCNGSHDVAMHRHYQSMFDAVPGDTVGKNAVLLHRVNLEALLSRLDAATMHAGLEARVPFTDHVLVEKMFQLPFRYRIDVRDADSARAFSSAELESMGVLRPKRVLRSLARKLMPGDLAMRKKASFPTGVAIWFQTVWQEWVVGYLRQSPFARFLLRPAFLDTLLVPPAMAGMWLWPIMNLAMWGDQEFC